MIKKFKSGDILKEKDSENYFLLLEIFEIRTNAVFSDYIYLNNGKLVPTGLFYFDSYQVLK